MWKCIIGEYLLSWFEVCLNINDSDALQLRKCIVAPKSMQKVDYLITDGAEAEKSCSSILSRRVGHFVHTRRHYHGRNKLCTFEYNFDWVRNLLWWDVCVDVSASTCYECDHWKGGNMKIKRLKKSLHNSRQWLQELSPQRQVGKEEHMGICSSVWEGS